MARKTHMKRGDRKVLIMLVIAAAIIVALFASFNFMM